MMFCNVGKLLFFEFLPCHRYRIADERGGRLGDEVGYTIRFDDVSDPLRTRIRVMTDGLLIR